MDDALALKIPDRVPVTLAWGFFPAYYSGMTCAEYMYDHERAMQASIRVHEEFQPDVADSPFGSRVIGTILDTLDYGQLRWPGRHFTANTGYQFIEKEYMRADEYDHFIQDPTDWMIRVYWPRIFGNLESFSGLPPLKHLVSYLFGFPSLLVSLGNPAVVATLEVLKKAGEAAMVTAEYAKKYWQTMTEKGFPRRYGGLTQAPFDTLGDYLRGTKEIMLDMYRRPEKLLEAIEVLTPWMLEIGLRGGRASGNSKIFIPLHKGSDVFMSDEQFRVFYWPSLKKVIEGLVNEGMNPVLFVEGDHTSRLEIMRDVPAKKLIYHMEKTDMVRAKEVLGDRVCLQGNVPITLLCTGSPDEVEKYCKNLIWSVGQKGGFILDASVPVDDARPDNIKAMIDAAGKGCYH